VDHEATDVSAGDLRRRPVRRRGAGGVLAGQPGVGLPQRRHDGLVIGIDGMDPVLSGEMMKEGQLPNLAKLRDAAGFSPLARVARRRAPSPGANFINAPGRAATAFFASSTRHRTQCRPSTPPPRRCPARAAGRWANTNPPGLLAFNHKPAPPC